MYIKEAQSTNFRLHLVDFVVQSTPRDEWARVPVSEHVPLQKKSANAIIET